MPWLPMYADENDLEALLAWLNDEQEIAFIVSNGHKKWIARKSLEKMEQGRYCLWHTPSGLLPLLAANSVIQKKLEQRGYFLWPKSSRPLPRLVTSILGFRRVVRDPWKGWTERLTGADPLVPYFGPGHPGVIWLNVRVEGRDPPGSLGMSSFEWIGNHYKCIGHAAPESTSKWWRRLKRRVEKIGAKVPRQGALDVPFGEISALPSAHRSILDGQKGELNPL
jgi:hypothetical protein